MNKMIGSTVLVTGGSRGIGRCISQIFAKNGARIFVVYRNDADKAHECIESLSGEGHRSFRVDVSKPVEVSSLFEQLTDNEIYIDVLINNAGIGYHHPIDKVSYAEWQQGWQEIIQTNLIAPSNMCYHAAHTMIKKSGWYII